MSHSYSNKVGPDEVDEELHDEIQQECGKYGKVENVVIYQVAQALKWKWKWNKTEVEAGSWNLIIPHFSGETRWLWWRWGACQNFCWVPREYWGKKGQEWPGWKVKIHLLPHLYFWTNLNLFRFFGGRTVSALIYDQEMYDQQDFSA